MGLFGETENQLNSKGKKYKKGNGKEVDHAKKKCLSTQQRRQHCHTQKRPKGASRSTLMTNADLIGAAGLPLGDFALLKSPVCLSFCPPSLFSLCLSAYPRACLFLSAFYETPFACFLVHALLRSLDWAVPTKMESGVQPGQ